MTSLQARVEGYGDELAAGRRAALEFSLCTTDKHPYNRNYSGIDSLDLLKYTVF